MFDSSSQTLREDEKATLRENRDSSATIREGQSAAGTGTVGGYFRDYRIVRQLPSTSTEADIFVIEKVSAEYILKLYRYGIDPKIDILQSIKALSETHPQNFIRVYEADFDKGGNRWFEVQEYAKDGTLQAVLDDRTKLTVEQQSTLFSDVARQVGESLNLLHQNNLLHLDIKPSNILLRSMNPLDMVLIDFGIATSLASDMSKKFTQTRGTPMYQSPESYTGGMGRASDWWGLGMILLEIAAGAHPFKGLSANVIAYSVATEPVNIPENLDEGQRELFHGLLTRNPEKRWNWEQVSRWLNGERGIQQYFEETATEETNNKNPFIFMNQKYQTLAELAAAFARDEEAWNKGKEFLMRGYVRQWLEGLQEFDASVELDNLLSSVQDTDEKLFQFTQHYGRNLPFVFGGKAITLHNLFLFAGKAQKREPLSDIERKIVDAIGNGRLLSYWKDYIKSVPQEKKTDKEQDFHTFQTALESLKGKDQKEIAGFLDFYLHPQNYYCPFLKGDMTPQSVIEESSTLQGVPMTIQAWGKMNAKYILPKELIDAQSTSAKSYKRSLGQIKKMERDKTLLLRESHSDEERDEKENFAFVSMQDYLNGVYKWQWGYDEGSVRIIDTSLSRFKEQIDFASGFEREQIQLWIVYLEFLAKKTMRLSDNDKKLLQNVSLNNADSVNKRLREIVKANS